MTLFRFVPILISLACTGCIGTAILEGEDTSNQEFPTLHSVPDRPDFRSQKEFDQERDRIEQNHLEGLEKAQELRKNYSIE